MKQLAFVLTFFLGSGCALQSPYKKNQTITSDDLLLKEPVELKPADELTSSKINEDIDVLIYALKNGYGGRKYVPQDGFHKLIEELKDLREKDSSSQVLGNSIGKLFLQHVPDNHLLIQAGGKWCGEKIYEQGRVGRNIWRKKNPPWHVQYRKGIPIISLTAMPGAKDLVWKGFIESVQIAIQKNPKAVIIDLRGNSGGSDEKGREMAAHFFGQDPPRLIYKIFRSQTAATMALQWNAARLRAHRDLEGNQPVQQYKMDRIQKYKTLYAKAKSGSLPSEIEVDVPSGPVFDPKKGYTNPIFLLVDRECASSCEDILELFSSHPHAKRIGENSAGYVQFGNMGNVVLPNSHLLVQMATDFWSFKDGQWREFKGYEPDIRLTDGQDPLISALKLIKRP